MNYYTDGLADRLSKFARNVYPFPYDVCPLISLCLATESTDEHSWSFDRLYVLYNSMEESCVLAC